MSFKIEDFDYDSVRGIIQETDLGIGLEGLHFWEILTTIWVTSEPYCFPVIIPN